MTDEPPRQRALPIDPDAGFAAMDAAEFAMLREQIGSQNDVAVEMQTARRTLGRWERGERPVPGVAAVCIRLLAKEAAERRAATIAAAQAMGERIA